MRTFASKPAVLNKRLIRGQGMTEYIIIVALIALASVAAVGFFGTAVKAQFVNMGAELSGGASGALGTVQGAVQAEEGAATAKATLGNY